MLSVVLRPCPVILSGAKDPGCRTVGCVCIRKNLSRHSEHVLLHPGFFSAARFRMTEKGVILSVSDTPPGHARIPAVERHSAETCSPTSGILRHCVPQNDSYLVILSGAKDPVRRMSIFRNVSSYIRDSSA